MAPSTDTRPAVVVVDDEADVADVHALALEQDYRVETAYGGREALDVIDEDTDAVLLDRRMPDVSGDEVLERLRADGFDGVVVMTTAVDPDLNILEMDFDDYLSKPIRAETLRETLAQHLDRPGSDERLDTFFRAVSKLSVLESELADPDNHEEYRDLKRRAQELGSELEDEFDDFDDLVDTHQEILGDGGDG